MVDYFGIALNGFASGFGVIFAHEIWIWLKKTKLHRIPMDVAENLIEDVRDIGTKKHRRK